MESTSMNEGVAGNSANAAASPTPRFRFPLRRLFLLLTFCALVAWTFSPPRPARRGPWFIRAGMTPRQVLQVAGRPDEVKAVDDDEFEWRYRRLEGGTFFVKFRGGTVWFVVFI